jgi:hypothetical protein
MSISPKNALRCARQQHISELCASFPISLDPTRLLSDPTILSVSMNIRVIELGTTRHTARTLDKLAVDRVDDLSECGAKLDHSSTCSTG